MVQVEAALDAGCSGLGKDCTVSGFASRLSSVVALSHSLYFLFLSTVYVVVHSLIDVFSTFLVSLLHETWNVGRMWSRASRRWWRKRTWDIPVGAGDKRMGTTSDVLRTLD